jgi:hypothetical protein
MTASSRPLTPIPTLLCVCVCVAPGVMMAAVPNIGSKDDLVSVWLHEQARVFRDRLVDDSDRQWFNALCSEMLNSKLGTLQPCSLCGRGAEGCIFGVPMCRVILLGTHGTPMHTPAHTAKCSFWFECMFLRRMLLSLDLNSFRGFCTVVPQVWSGPPSGSLAPSWATTPTRTRVPTS